VRHLRGAAALALAAVLALASCGPAGPRPMPRYLVGAPYSLGGLWFYPQEEFARTETGVAAVIPDRRPRRITANGEVFDPTALIAAHRTLQLPAIVAVTNLDTGLTLRVRVNDRGPANPGRVIGLSQRASQLLGMGPEGTAPVRVTVDAPPSMALAAALPSEEPRGPVVVAAPRAEVIAEPLEALPDGQRPAAAPLRALRTAVPSGPAGGSDPTAPVALVPDRLPETVTPGPVAPGRLVLEVGRFFGAGPARQQAARFARLGARVVLEGQGRSAVHRVVIGPFADLAQADAAVAATVALGQAELTLRVE
jgi:rare lipoprotein A